MVHGVVALPGGGIIVAEGNEVRKYPDFKSTEPSARFDASPNLVERIGISPCAKYILGILPLEKAIVILSVDKLEVVSRRKFSKRPSAWAIASNGDASSAETLVVADKLGDVYSAPLLSNDKLVDEEGHSLSPPILGHISVLLDLAVSDGHLFTADRDEHIRISKYPHAFIIDKFLFGHQEYVSRLAVVNDFLVSGGGDNFVICWNWKTGEEVARLELDGSHVLSIKTKGDQAWICREESSKIVVVSIPKLEIIKTIEFDSPVTDVSLPEDSTDAYVALEDGVIKVSADDEKEKMNIERGASDSKPWSAAALRKPEFSRPTA